MRLAIAGDVHGQAQALRRMLGRLEVHGVDRIVSLGDLVDRGPDSVECVRMIRTSRFRARDGRRRRVELVLGNHELSLLNAHFGRKQRLRDGSWVVPVPASRSIADGLTDDDYLWLDSRPRYISVQEDGLDLLLVHGGIRREHARAPGWLGREKLDQLSRIGWLDEVTGEPLHPAHHSRRHFADEYPHDGPTVIFGHTSWPKIRFFPNAIGVDSSKHGRLAAVVLSSDAPPVELYEEHESVAGYSAAQQ